jgi:Sulfotransferase domain
LRMVPEPVPSAELARVVQENTFRVLSGGRNPGEQDYQSHYRRGSPGDWREHFDATHIDYFKKLYNPLLIKLGYESKEDW